MSSQTLTSRLNSLRAKTAELSVKEVKVPDSSSDVLTLFEANSSARADSANEWIIDVLPNLTPIAMYSMLKASQHARITDHRDHAKSSVSTICLYHMSIVYGYFLLNDLHVRPTPSAHARSWSQTSWKHEFANFLIDLPVPEFLEPILSQLHASQTDHTRNVFFIPSAAGFNHDIFFGRFIPLNFFSAIHDCTATMPGNSSRFAVLQDLFSRVLYTVTGSTTYHIPDFLGISIDRARNTQANYVNSKLYQIFSSVFNPVLFRDFQRRSTLATLSLSPVTFPSATSVNAYDLLFSATAPNLRELRVVLQAVSAVLTDHVPCKRNLGQFISSASGANILHHGYSTYALPTWTASNNANKPDLFNAITTLVHKTEDDRAADICFLQPPDAAFNGTTDLVDVRYAAPGAPDTPVNLPADRQLTRYWPASLRRMEPPTPAVPFPQPSALVKFEDPVHTYPRVLVLDTLGTKTTSAHLATLTGKVIESFEIDASTVEMPDVRKPLGLQNSMFADSAIPYTHVTPATSWRPKAPGSFLAPLARAAPNARPRLPASSLLHDRTQIMLPRFLPRIVETAQPTTLPGMTMRDNTNYIRYIQSFFGFRTVDGSSNAATLDAIPGMTNRTIHCWSCYSYTPYESSDEPLPDLSESKSYFIMNLRTLFGTDLNLIEVKHAYEALPVV